MNTTTLFEMNPYVENNIDWKKFTTDEKLSDIAHGKSLETMICSRPTLYQAQKWLRNNFNVHVNVMCIDYDDKLNKCKYNCSVVNFDKNLFQTSKTSYSYEETLNSGILLAIISTLND